MSGGKNSKAHFVWKCDHCASLLPHFTVSDLINLNLLGKHENSARFESLDDIPYNNENAQFAPFLLLDCRGLEFIGFDPKVMNSSLSDRLETDGRVRSLRVTGNVSGLMELYFLRSI